jgi:hypothetical protein
MILEDSTDVRRGIHMNRWRVGEDMGSKETDGCPLTDVPLHSPLFKSAASRRARIARRLLDLL